MVDSSSNSVYSQQQHCFCSPCPTRSAGASAQRSPMHPHPGFPTFARLDDVCGACAPAFDDDLPAAAKKKSKANAREAEIGWRPIAAVAAVALVATAALYRRRG